MYLGLINDKCKSLFLGLAQKLVKADHVVDAAEKEMIDQYAFEMGIDVVVPHKDFYSLLDDINQLASDQEKRIIVFELMGLAVADNVYAPEEQKMMSLVAQRFLISSEEMTRLAEMIKQYYEFVKNTHDFIFTNSK